MKENKSWRTDIIQLQDLLQNYSNQDSVKLVKEWTRQQNKIESSKVGPYKYSQLIFDKEQMQFGERIFFSTNGTGTTEHPCLKNKTIMKKKKKTRHNLTPSTKINLKYIIDLNKKL